MTTSSEETPGQEQRAALSEAESPRPVSKPLRWWFNRLLAPAIFLAVGVLLILLLGVAQRIGWLSPSAGEPTAVSTADDDEVFTCPMHPQIRQPDPGRCPICGMKLVVATPAGGADLDQLSVMIAPAQRRLANIATADVRRDTVSATIETVGTIMIDESRMATIASYIDGRLERLFADYTGVDVAKGDHLAVIYSPDLYSAQVEYVEIRKALAQSSSAALAVVRQTQEKLATNARHRLVELGMTEQQIIELEKTGTAKSRLTVYSSIGGTVIEKLAVEGKYVKAGDPIYRIADLSTVWLMLELYPEDAARIRFGQRVEAEMQSLPGEVFNGRVAFIDPRVDRKKRTVGVRVEFLNNDGRLRPGDYSNATIYLPIGERGEVYDKDLAGRWISPMHPQIIRDAPGQCPICGMDLVPTSRFGYSDVPVEQPTSLYVPRSALLMAGNNSVVYVETEPGRFEIRPVTIGPILRDRAIILGGVTAGEKVATAGNFLIDSQMQLAGKPSLIDPTRAKSRDQGARVRDQGEGGGKLPLEFTDIHVASVSGIEGENLESLFAAYFRIQKTLASDDTPVEADAKKLNRFAKTLAANPLLPSDAQAQLAKIARHSEHLHHLDLDKARHDAFRPISHAIITLATLVRGDTASQPFHHMFCPMVKGGAGHWLQANSKLVNPYWGSEMLDCGEEVRQLQPQGH